MFKKCVVMVLGTIAFSASAAYTPFDSAVGNIESQAFKVWFRENAQIVQQLEIGQRVHFTGYFILRALDKTKGILLQNNPAINKEFVEALFEGFGKLYRNHPILKKHVEFLDNWYNDYRKMNSEWLDLLFDHTFSSLFFALKDKIPEEVLVHFESQFDVVYQLIINCHHEYYVRMEQFQRDCQEIKAALEVEYPFLAAQQ